jgi:hypothetical protein
MTSQNAWKMSLFEHFFKVLSLYLEARIRIRIKVRKWYPVLGTFLARVCKNQIVLFCVGIHRFPEGRYLTNKGGFYYFLLMYCMGYLFFCQNRDTGKKLTDPQY